MLQPGLEEHFRLLHVPSTGSTNEDALARARAGDQGRLWIVADRQLSGRGRLGRVWDSPSGNLYATLLLTDPCERHLAPQLGFVAGVAAARAVVDIVGRGRGVAIKWPNDILCGSAKLAGILVEGTTAPDGGLAAVLGFGVNCASHPAGLPYDAIHLGVLAGAGGSRDALMERLSAHMADTLALWARGRNFAALRRAWLDLALPRGALLAVTGAVGRVAGPAGRVTGTFKTVDADGRLILETGSGCVTVEAGDVFLVDQKLTAAS